MNAYCSMPSVLGDITLQANHQGLLGAWFEVHTTQPEQLGKHDPEHTVLREARRQLEQYFLGQRRVFELPLAAKGTPFQQQVWQALTTIPYGHVWSYQQLAQAIGNPKAVRAVGLANGKNPLSVIVPCHRVIGKNGKLTGYAGGVDRKQQLLRLEGYLAQ
ncbi:methylated-DNA--[protein]-cysteine S-methyltransferase [Vibrio sp. AK197]